MVSLIQTSRTMYSPDVAGRVNSDDYNKAIRDRANASFHEVHQTFNSPYPMANLPLKASSPYSKQFSPRTSRTMQHEPNYMYIPDKEAASRLKSLLGQRGTVGTPDTPKQIAATLQSPRTPLLTEISEPRNQTMTTAENGKEVPGPHIEELLPVINSQSTYIQQLEGENRFCKEELSSLKSRIQNVSDENTRLHEELKEAVVNAVLQQEQFTQKSEDKADSTGGDKSMDRQLFGRFGQELEKMKALHDGKTERLEAQLASTREQHERLDKECEELRGRLRMAESVNLLSREDSIIEDGLCIRCAQYEAVIANTQGSPNVKAVERITKERDDLMNTLTTMKAKMDDMKHREADAYVQVKHSVNMVEQAQLEKTQAFVQKEQVAEDLEKLQRRMTELIAEHQEKLQKERQLTRRECENQMEQLNQKITQLSQELVCTQGRMEKVTREKVAVISELEQAKNQISQHEREVEKVSHDIKLSTATAKVQRDEAFRQMDRLRHSTEQQITDKEQEASRQRKELYDVRRRLESAERDTTSSKEQCIKLAEKLNSVEKEASSLRIARNTLEKSKIEEVKSVSRRAKQQVEELQQTMYENENKHSMTVSELEGMLANQNSLIQRLKGEGKLLTGQMDRVSEKYRSETRRLRQENAELMSKAERLAIQHAEMEADVIEHGKTHRKMRSRLQQLEDHAQRSGKQVYTLLQKQTSLLDERQTLAKEVDFLHSQLRHSPRGNTSVPKHRQRHGELDLTPQSENSINQPTPDQVRQGQIHRLDQEQLRASSLT